MPEISHEIGKERESAHLLKTGQTTQYGGYADDGYYEKGLSKQYDVLTTGRYAGTTSITVATKTDLISNNCVYDRRTKLMWSRYAAGSVGPNSNGTLPWTTNANGEGIFDFVAAANLALLGGYSDWRIPNAFELAALAVIEYPSAPPGPTAFPGWPTSNPFWSSTTLANNIAYALEVRFTNGATDYATKTSILFVALVRGG